MGESGRKACSSSLMISAVHLDRRARHFALPKIGDMSSSVEGLLHAAIVLELNMSLAVIPAWPIGA